MEPLQQEITFEIIMLIGVIISFFPFFIMSLQESREK